MTVESPRVIVYRDRLLPYSETFIAAQVGALARYKPIYVGMRCVPGLELGDTPTFVVNNGYGPGKLREIRARLSGFPRNFVDEVRSLSPKLVHAHFAPDSTHALLLARTLKVPLLVTCHGWDVTILDSLIPSSPGNLLYRLRRSALQQQASAFIAVSKFLRNRMITLGFPTERIHTHSIGINRCRFHPGLQRERETTVLFVGRLTEKKGLTYLLQAAAILAQRGKPCSLVIIGEGDQRAALEAQAKALHLDCTFLGKCSPDQVIRWMQRARLLCVPSITAANGDAEGLGMVLLEAQACGLPVVASRSGGIPEAMDEGETGFLTPERDATGLAEMLGRLLHDNHLWQRFSDAGPNLVASRFDLSLQTIKLEKIYDQTIDNFNASKVPR